MYIDTHCHVFSEYYDDIEKVIKNAKENGVNKIIVNGCDVKSNLEILDLASKYEEVYVAIGFHPEDLSSFDISFLEKHINNPKVVAIGEIGLDYHYDNSEEVKNIQNNIFKRQIELAIKYNKPVIIHSRDAIEDTYNIISKYNNLKCVLHCYGGSLEMAKRFVKLGIYLGIGGIVTFKNAKTIKDVVKNIDLKHIILETDSPYLTPEPFRGLRNEPMYIPVIAKKIAEIKEVSLDEVKSSTTDNAYALFDF